MLYDAYEVQRSLLAGASTLAQIGSGWMQNPANPLAYSQMGPIMASALDVFAHASAPRGKPEFGLERTIVEGREVAVHEEIVLRKPFGQLKRFRARGGVEGGPKLLMIAPMSGHYATLLRGTVERMLPAHDVYITDWRDAKLVPLDEGDFDLDDYVDYLIEFMHAIGPDEGGRGAHMLAVCQPSVAGLRRRLPDERRQGSAAAAHAHHDGRADRHPKGADRGQHGRDPAALLLVREECDRDRALSLSGRGAAGLSGLPPARRLHGDEFRQPPGQPLGACSATSSTATTKRPTRPRISTTNIAPSAT